MLLELFRLTQQNLWECVCITTYLIIFMYAFAFLVFIFYDSKGIIVLLNKGQKLDESNYNIWHCKVQYVLDNKRFWRS